MYLLQRGVRVRSQAAVQHADLLEVGQHRQRRVGAVAVTQRLEMRVGAAIQVDAWFLGFHEEAHVAEVRLQVEGVVGAFLRTGDADATFDLDLLLVRIVFALVVHVPAERFPERIDEVLARFRFLVAGLQVVVARVPLETVDQLADARMGNIQCAVCGFLAHNGCAPSLRMSRYCW